MLESHPYVYFNWYLLRDHFAGPECVRGSRMGRGRQKAKHTKVARELKYFSPNTDLSQLERELASASSNDPWAEYADKYNVDDEDDEHSDDEH